ncbi:type-F conjugative transfer system secretin TraK [Shewanella sp. UCD-KL12]|uniref:TraK domain-containing protein n=1 Tax=Shewanella sp. UCD-KL12 TaxID=1917163 RepID=UPI000970277C|nr:type-F conjugative transfer system secretin TraK [Shewanella sp. UCD-KL12]
MLTKNKQIALVLTSLSVFVLDASANEPVDFFEKPQGDPINEFILPVNTSNQRLPSAAVEESNEQSSANNPVQFIYDSLKSSVPKEATHTPSAMTVDSFGMPQVQMASSNGSFSQSLRASYKPVQEYELQPGQNIAVAVAAGLMNRIKTNFKMVAVRTSDENSIIEASDGYIYITINSMSPVGLMIYEEGMPETAVSLVLQPDNSPPAMVDVKVHLTQTQKYMALERKRERDRLDKIEQLSKVQGGSSTTTSYVERMKEMLTPIAQNGIPKGFTETSEIPVAMLKPCSVSIRQKTAQRLVGSREYIDVVVMYNHTSYNYQIKEEQCLSRDALAVALVDQSILPPGFSTEVYIVRDKLYKEKQEKSNRRRQYSASELGLTKGD